MVHYDQKEMRALVTLKHSELDANRSQGWQRTQFKIQNLLSAVAVVISILALFNQWRQSRELGERVTSLEGRMSAAEDGLLSDTEHLTSIEKRLEEASATQSKPFAPSPKSETQRTTDTPDKPADTQVPELRK